MTWLWIVIAVAVVAAGALVPLLGRRDAESEDVAAIVARDRYALLGHYVDNPVATDDPEAEALLHQGRERWNSAGGVLASASSAAQFRLAEQIAREGLTQVAAAHRKLGIPGPTGVH